MRYWVEIDKKTGTAYVNFQTDNHLENIILDELLEFNWIQSEVPISGERDKKVKDGALQTARLIGHESQRTIIIKI